MREIIPITSEEQWLGLRENDITSTMVSALFGLSPYITEFELYHDKKNGIRIPFKANDRTEKGKRVEAYAAQEVGASLNCPVRPVDLYIRNPELRMGSSFDWEILEGGKWKLLEIKAVDHFVYRNQWSAEEIPAHIEIQAQHELECAGDKYDEIIVAAFTGIYDFHLHRFKKDEDFGQGLCDQVKYFWQTIELGNPPDPNFSRDGDVIELLYRKLSLDPVDYTDNEEFEALLAKYFRIKKEASEADAEAKALKAEIHFMAEDHAEIYTGRYKLKAGRTKDRPGTLITEAMVGTLIGARAGYRQCLVSDLMK